MNISTITKRPGTQPYIRALATSQGNHWGAIRASEEGAEELDLQAEHDRISDIYFKRADDELAIALDLRDWRLIHNHIRASNVLRAEGYRFEQMEDERREQARAHVIEARDAGQAGSYVCETMLRRDGLCEHTGDAA